MHRHGACGGFASSSFVKRKVDRRPPPSSHRQSLVQTHLPPERTCRQERCLSVYSSLRPCISARRSVTFGGPSESMCTGTAASHSRNYCATKWQMPALHYNMVCQTCWADAMLRRKCIRQANFAIAPVSKLSSVRGSRTLVVLSDYWTNSGGVWTPASEGAGTHNLSIPATTGGLVAVSLPS